MYKKYIFFTFAAIQSFLLNAGVINIGGVDKQIDSLEYRMIGPGVSYTKFTLPDYPLSAYLLEVDLTNPYNLIETFQAQNQVGRTEAMTSAYSRLNSELHTTLGGVNGNFWIVSGQGQPTELLGVPHSGSAVNGEMITDPNAWNRGHGEIGFAMLDASKKLWLDDIEFAGTVKISNIGEYPISEINRKRDSENELVLFNSFLGSQPTRSDDNGIEVFIKLKDGESWSVNQDVECIVTRVVSNKGANLLEGEVVLSGSGAAQTFLQNLSEGDFLTVNMSVKTLTDNQYPRVEQMITGNALVMKDGILTNRNYNETYNTQLYPRTGIASSQDGKTLYLIVIDKMGKSVGASTETMCNILKAFGADNATSMDGGGSAQMMVDGLIVNNPADGRERAVANGWFLFHNAPDDNEIEQIDFNDLRRELPSLAIYKPTILGYNQYGVLVDKDLANYTLSCTEGLGEITDDGAFIANGTLTSGTLTVEYNEAKVSKQIKIVSGNIAFRLDSVLIDNRFEYPIEVQSTSESEILSIPPSLLTWSVEDNTVSSIEEGVLKGLKNGMTILEGSVGDVNDDLKVYVEISDNEIFVHDDFSKTENWSLSASSQLNASLSAIGIPSAWSTGLAVNFTYKSGRAPYIKITNDKRLYSLPDSIKIVFNTGGISIDKALLYLRANNSSKSVSKEFNNFVTNGGDTEISFALSDFFETDDIAIYPIYFDNLHFLLNSQTESQSYSLAFKEIKLYYDKSSESGISSQASHRFSVYPNPVLQGNNLHIAMKENNSQAIRTEIYNLQGQQLEFKQHGIYGDGEITLPTTNLTSGAYLLKVYEDEKSNIVKIIIQ